MKARKGKKCKCGKTFYPYSSFDKFCSASCKMKYAEAKKERKKETSVKKRTVINQISDREKIAQGAQRAVNRWIKQRDRGNPCISCGKPLNWNEPEFIDASHFRSIGSSKFLRFNVFNIHASCRHCNQVLSGNIPSYTEALILKYGKERVDYLKNNRDIATHTNEYYIRINRIFTKWLKQRAKRKGLQTIAIINLD